MFRLRVSYVLTSLMVLAVLLVLGACGGGGTSTPSATLSGGDNLVAAAGGNPPSKPVSIPGAYPTAGAAPILIHYYDDGSYDPGGGEIVKWEWNFADEAEDEGGWQDYTDTQGDAWHTYNENGTFAAHLRVTNDSGKKGIGHIEITLDEDLNANPLAELVADPNSGDAPLAVEFDASKSYDPDGTVDQYDYDWDSDGTYDLIDGGATPSHTYATYGSYTATVRVTDDDGAQDTATEVVEVNAVPVAVLTADPTSGDAPLTVDFDASASNDPDGTIEQYDYDWMGMGRTTF